LSWLDEWKEPIVPANADELPVLDERAGLEAVIGGDVGLDADEVAVFVARALELQAKLRPLRQELEECKEVIRRYCNGKPWSAESALGSVKVGATTPDRIVRELRFNEGRFLALDERSRRRLVEAGLVRVTHAFVPEVAEETDENLRAVVRSVLDVVADLKKGRKGTVSLVPQK